MDFFRLFIKNHRIKRAVRILSNLLSTYSDDASVYNRLAIVYAKVGNYHLAEKSFERAMDLDPSAASFHNLGVIFYEMKQYTKSKKMFERSIKLEKDVAMRYVAYAKVLEKLKLTDKMIQALESATGLDPSLQMINILCDAYSRVGRRDDARQLKKLIDKNKTQAYVKSADKMIESTRQFNEKLDNIAKKRGLL